MWRKFFSKNLKKEKFRKRKIRVKKKVIRVKRTIGNLSKSFERKYGVAQIWTKGTGRINGWHKLPNFGLKKG